jgi:hypothetical protein
MGATRSIPYGIQETHWKVYSEDLQRDTQQECATKSKHFATKYLWLTFKHETQSTLYKQSARTVL